jgi:hypothetical protein
MSGRIIKEILPDEQIKKVDLHEGLYSICCHLLRQLRMNILT